MTKITYRIEQKYKYEENWYEFKTYDKGITAEDIILKLKNKYKDFVFRLIEITSEITEKIIS